MWSAASGREPPTTRVLRGRGRICELRGRAPGGKLCPMPEPLIDRNEVVALLFNVSDIAVTIGKIHRLLIGEDDGEEEADEG